MTGFAFTPVQPVAEQSTIVGHMTNGNEIYVVRREFADGREDYEVQLEVSDFCTRPVGLYATFDEAVSAAELSMVIYV
jgi:hypothetical protein